MGKKLKIEKSKKKQTSIFSKNSDEIFDKSLLNSTHTEIFGNEKINIDGCMGVYEYRDTYIKLKLKKGALILTGSGFDIVYYENRLITVRGKISSLEFGG